MGKGVNQAAGNKTENMRNVPSVIVIPEGRESRVEHVVIAPSKVTKASASARKARCACVTVTEGLHAAM